MYGLLRSLHQFTRQLELVVVGSNIIQKFQNGLRSVALLIAAVQDNRVAAVIKDNIFAAIDTAHTLIAGQTSVIVVEITDKDHIALRQFCIVQPFAQAPPVDAALIVSDTAFKALAAGLLHLNIVVGTSSVVQVNIQPDPMSGNIIRQVLLFADILNAGNVLFQQTLQKKLAYLGLPHYLPKHKII